MGLHSNAEIGYYTQAAKDMWCHLIDLQPQIGMIWHPSSSVLPLNILVSKEEIKPFLNPLGESGGSISRDEYISQVAQDIQNKLPELFDLDRIRKQFSGNISPTSVVLLQELERFNKLVVRMQRSLIELQRVRGRSTRQKDIEKTQ